MLALNGVSSRSLWLARAIDAELCLLKCKPPYLNLEVQILKILAKYAPREIVIQLPSGPLLGAALSARVLRRDAKVIADVHTGFLVYRWYGRMHRLLNKPFVPLLRYADLVLLHNATNFGYLPCGAHQRATVLYDPFYVVRQLVQDASSCRSFDLGEYCVFPASWHADEPIERLIRLWAEHHLQPTLVVTGHPRPRVVNQVLKYVGRSKGIVLTGHLEYADFLTLVANSRFVISLTMSDFDSQASSYEALAFGKPIVASETLALKMTLDGCATYFQIDDPIGLCTSVTSILDNYDAYVKKVSHLAETLECQIRKRIMEVF